MKTLGKQNWWSFFEMSFWWLVPINKWQKQPRNKGLLLYIYLLWGADPQILPTLRPFITMPLNNQCGDGPSYLNSFPNRIHWQILVRTFPDHILSTNKVVGIYKDFVYKNYNNNKKKQVILIRGSTWNPHALQSFTICAIYFHIIIFCT